MVNKGSIAYPLIAVIGDVGVGKTLKAVDICRKYFEQFGNTKHIFSNILLFNIPYVELDVNDFDDDIFLTKKYDLVINTKDETGELSYKSFDLSIHHYSRKVMETGIAFENGLMIVDEGQDLSDAYRFFSSPVMSFNHFVSQIRHYDLEFFIITQRLSFISSRLRKLLNYHYEIDYHLYYDEKLGIKTFTTGIIKVKYYRLNNDGRTLYKTKVQDLRCNFEYYSSKQDVNKRKGVFNEK